MTSHRHWSWIEKGSHVLDTCLQACGNSVPVAGIKANCGWTTHMCSHVQGWGNMPGWQQSHSQPANFHVLQR